MTEPIWEKGYTQNRELSWLQFNARVLEEAEDETVPLLERVKFLSIFTSNLDEFYMIRVGSLGDVAALGGHGVDNKSGLTAKEQLERIYAATAPLYERRDRVFRRVERELGAEGLQRLRMSELTQDEHHYIRQLFRTAIQPLLSPQIVDAHHPFPHLASKTLHVGVRLSRKKSEFWGLIPMPPSVPELLFLPEQNGICRYVPLEEVLRGIHQIHVHGHAPGIHLHILPPLLHDLLRHRPWGELPVVGPLGDDVHAVVLAEQTPLFGVVPGQVAGASAVGLGGLAGLAEVGDQRLALFHLEGILRLLQRLAEGTQLGGQAAVEGVDHAALPLLQPEHPLCPAQLHVLRQTPPLEGGVVRPLGVAGIEQPRHTHIKAAPWVRFQRQVKHCRCS